MTQPFNTDSQQVTPPVVPNFKPRRFGSNRSNPPFTNKITVFNKNNLAFVSGRSEHLPNNRIITCMLTAVLFGILGVLLAWLFVGNFVNDLELEQSGIQTQGRVINSNKNEDNHGKTFYLYYSYDVTTSINSGKVNTYSTKALVDETTYRQYTNNLNIPVRYLKDNPSVSQIPGENSVFADRLVAMLSALVLFFLTWIFGVTGYRKLRFVQLLERSAYLIEGRIVSTNADELNKQAIKLKVQYSFTNLLGQSVQKQYSAFYGKYEKQLNLAPGTPVGIVYFDSTHFELL